MSFVLAMVQHPDVQARAQKEIDEVTKSERLPTMADRDSMPYIRSIVQEVLRWQLNMRKELGDNINHDHIKEFLWKTLKSGQVVPGYGHGVLRNPDPRFIALQQFCETRPELLADPVIQLVKKVWREMSERTLVLRMELSRHPKWHPMC